MLLHYTELELYMNVVTGKNRAFMTREINKQKKFGNRDIFDCFVDTDTKEITLGLGESQAEFRYNPRSEKWEHEYGRIYKYRQCLDMVQEIGKHHFGNIVVNGVEYERRDK